MNAAVHVEASPSPSVETARVLVVEDDAATLGALVRTLQSLGHEVSTARGWAEALLAFRTTRVDVVVLDIVMPLVDGLKLTRILKANSADFVPVLLLTSLADPGSRRRALDAGADDFLTKPADDVELDTRIRSMLRIRELTTRLRDANRRLETLALTDALTGLANRRAATEALGREYSRAVRYDQEMSVLILDIDHFKSVNDTYGHDAGDRCLRTLAALLEHECRDSDHCARFGGEEFLVVAPETGRSGAEAMAERIRARVEQISRRGEFGPANVTVSIGTATLSASDASAQGLVKRADEYLYAAKHEGRNRVHSGR